MKKYFTLLLLIIAFQGFSQTYPITSITISLPASPDANTANWGSGTSLLTITATTLADNGRIAPDVIASKLLVTIKKGGVKAYGDYTINSAPSSDFNTPNKIWKGDSAISFLGKSFVLPPGDYEICVQFYSIGAAGPTPISEEKTQAFSIIAQTYPITNINISLPVNPDPNTDNWRSGTSMFEISASSIVENDSVPALVLNSKLFVYIKKNGIKFFGDYTINTAPASNFDTPNKIYRGDSAVSYIGKQRVLPVGDYELSVQFFGNGVAGLTPISEEKTKAFSISADVPAKKSCAIQVTDVASKWGKSVLLTARLQETGAAGNTDLPNKELKFYKLINKGDSLIQYIGSDTTDANGVASITIKDDCECSGDTIIIGNILVSFAGDANYYAQSGTGTLTIEKHVTNLIVAPTTAVFGQPVVFSATLTDNDNDGKGVSNQELRFYKISPGTREGDTARVYIGSGTTNSNGVASVQYPLGWEDQYNSISVSFAGDVNYSAQSGTGTLTSILVGVENISSAIPTKFDLLQNYPNPFNPTSSIRYEIPETGFVNISIYNILGREIKVLVNEEKSPGHYEIILDAGGLASGVYLYKLQSGSFAQIKKFILLK